MSGLGVGGDPGMLQLLSADFSIHYEGAIDTSASGVVSFSGTTRSYNPRGGPATTLWFLVTAADSSQIVTEHVTVETLGGDTLSVTPATASLYAGPPRPSPFCVWRPTDWSQDGQFRPGESAWMTRSRSFPALHMSPLGVPRSILSHGDTIHVGLQLADVGVLSGWSADVVFDDVLGFLPGSFGPAGDSRAVGPATSTTNRVVLSVSRPDADTVLTQIGESTSFSFVRRFLDGGVAPGDHEVTWDGRDQAGRPVASGVYLIRLDGAHERWVRKAHS